MRCAFCKGCRIIDGHRELKVRRLITGIAIDILVHSQTGFRICRVRRIHIMAAVELVGERKACPFGGRIIHLGTQVRCTRSLVGHIDILHI